MGQQTKMCFIKSMNIEDLYSLNILILSELLSKLVFNCLLQKLNLDKKTKLN